jgi:predicted  nucleic acid-binding Zn-ribbon protein
VACSRQAKRIKTVRDQFAMLRELQRLDDRLRSLHVEQQHLPAQLQPYETAYAEAHQGLVRLQEESAHTERQRRALERELESAHTHLARTQSKLHDVKTNKEYSAVLAEIATGKQHIAVLEDQVLELMERSEQQRQSLRSQEQRMHDTGQILTVQCQEVQQAQAALQQRIAEEEAQRQRVVAVLTAPLYAAYQRLVAQRGGQAVVQIQAGTCSGCHLKVQPQLVSEIRRQDKLIMCPHCQRMLLWPAE